MPENTNPTPKEATESDFISPHQHTTTWRHAHENLFSDAIPDIRLGVDLAERFLHTSAGDEPFIAATVALRRCQLFHHEKHQRGKRLGPTLAAEADPSIDPQSILSLAYSMAIVRMVNAVTDRDFRNFSLEEAQKMKSVHNSVSERAAARELPKELVEVRHAATHSQLPSLEQLVYCACLAVAYLELYYWRPRAGRLRQVPLGGRPLGSSSATGQASIDEIPGVALAMRIVDSVYPELSSDRRGKRRISPMGGLDAQVGKRSTQRPGVVRARGGGKVSAEVLSSGISVPVPPGFGVQRKGSK